MQQCLLDKYIDDDISFVIFKYPNSENYTLIIGEEKKLGHHYDALNGLEAFVISPFDIISHPILAIIPHQTITDKTTILSYLTPSIKKKIEETETIDENILNENQDFYKQKFQEFHQSILNREFSKLVLSRTANLQTHRKQSLGGLFQKATSISGAFVYLFHTPTAGTWLGATPELLLKGSQDSWQTVALAGTRSVVPSGMDWDKKNKEEQRFVSDYICQVVTEMGYKAYPQDVETIRAAGLEHLKTVINFNKCTDSRYAIGTLIDGLHPTPAICGLPKKVSFEFIKSHEGYDRSYYSGLVGWMSPSDVQLYVNLRCLRIQADHSFQLFAGGGLVESSDLEAEWKETKAKMQTLLSIIQ